MFSKKKCNVAKKLICFWKWSYTFAVVWGSPSINGLLVVNVCKFNPYKFSSINVLNTTYPSLHPSPNISYPHSHTPHVAKLIPSPNRPLPHPSPRPSPMLHVTVILGNFLIQIIWLFQWSRNDITHNGETKIQIYIYRLSPNIIIIEDVFKLLLSQTMIYRWMKHSALPHQPLLQPYSTSPKMG